MPPAPDTTPDPKCDVDALRKGDRLSRISYMEIAEPPAPGDASLRVRNETGMEWTIGRSIVANECYSATQYLGAPEKVTRTELARLLQEEVRDSVFSLSFLKAPDAKKQAELLEGADLANDKKRRKVAADLQKGEERVIVAHVLDFEHAMGRLRVCDLEAPGNTKGAKTRLVDLRTINWLVFRNKRYELK